MGEFIKGLEIYKISNGAYPVCGAVAPGCLDTYVSRSAVSSKFTTSITPLLVSANAYKGDLNATLKKIPDVTDFSIKYSEPSHTVTWPSIFSDKRCDNKTSFSNYYMVVSATPAISNLDGTYWFKEYYVSTGLPTGALCSGN